MARVAFERARGRRRRVASIDKANVLETSRLWRTVVTDVARDYPDVALEHVYIDTCAMRLATSPASFDVILADNLFGDILSDQAASIAGSLGLLPSATIGGSVDLYEPVHGSAPDIAGKGWANPIGAIASAAMLLRLTAGMEKEAAEVDHAIEVALASGARTRDLAGPGDACSPLTRWARRSKTPWRRSAIGGIPTMPFNSRTLFDKVWDAHVVHTLDDGRTLLYIDRHLVHEVTSPQAFEGLRLAGRPVRRPDLTFATVDHNVPTTARHLPITDPLARAQVEALRTNATTFGVPLFDFNSGRQGIVHVIGPELGLTLPGTTIVCGDSHTSTHGAFGALAFGIGTSEVEHVLATQCLVQQKPKAMRVSLSARSVPVSPRRTWRSPSSPAWGSAAAPASRSRSPARWSPASRWTSA